jgi:hypothetical protein
MLRGGQRQAGHRDEGKEEEEAFAGQMGSDGSTEELKRLP